MHKANSIVRLRYMLSIFRQPAGGETHKGTQIIQVKNKTSFTQCNHDLRHVHSAYLSTYMYVTYNIFVKRTITSAVLGVFWQTEGRQQVDTHMIGCDHSVLPWMSANCPGPTSCLLIPVFWVARVTVIRDGTCCHDLRQVDIISLLRVVLCRKWYNNILTCDVFNLNLYNYFILV